jgi:hypothetical protein
LNAGFCMLKTPFPNYFIPFLIILIIKKICDEFC